MPNVTVAIPVYNGEAYLERCLLSVQSQTEEDFAALIYDNASNDGTREIAESFCRTDRRFTYYRQSENRGPTNNFVDALAASTTEFFFWLAHDDFVSPNYIAELHRLFTDYPHINLAVPRVLSIHEDGREYGDTPWPDGMPADRISRIDCLLRKAPPSWFYALWRTETVRDAFGRAWAHYPYGWGSDHLTIYTQIIRDKLAGTNAACLTQTIQHRPVRIRPPVKHMVELRYLFKQFCLEEAMHQDFTPGEMKRLRPMINAYASHRCYGYRKIARRALREFSLALVGKNPS
ncbi:glycosyltransferase family 2 protein [Parvibaculum sp.]|uniref:glycosyltransferase family 2 protein n=1 Tax=Parvibaculum sp. TaxID=2024848 RepID=UPI001DD7D8BD|nr:glycosyltransferase family 2 protein [Parvibaculum sp.]MBX3491064.1 glycosyltransferase family 2 protein [Parvibaculum sp.]MCW5728884.1 glycosyltransferase family 2 protein [Parvibaculum sp.]